jgi:hypothetical protein
MLGMAQSNLLALVPVALARKGKILEPVGRASELVDRSQRLAEARDLPKVKRVALTSCAPIGARSVEPQGDDVRNDEDRTDANDISQYVEHQTLLRIKPVSVGS